MNIVDVLKRLHAGEKFDQEELDELYESYYYDEDIYEVENKGTLIYQVILQIGNEYYAGYQYRNDMWGSEWDENQGLIHVYPKEIKTITWTTEEEK